MEWYWQGESKVLGGKPIPVPHCSPQMPSCHVGYRSQNLALRDCTSLRPGSCECHSNYKYIYVFSLCLFFLTSFD
jgi:hypothetical protein